MMFRVVFWHILPEYFHFFSPTFAATLLHGHTPS
jgi:hypothetical protein